MKIVIGLGFLIVTCTVAWIVWCPCSRVPGAWLVGTEVAEEVADWAFVQDEGLCQLEVPGPIPHSVNLNCMSDAGELFVSCSRCAGKRWSAIALEERRGRIRIGYQIYPVTIAVLREPATLDRVWRARARKRTAMGNAGIDEFEPRPNHWWAFRIDQDGVEVGRVPHTGVPVP